MTDEPWVVNTLEDPWDARFDGVPDRLHFVCPHCGADVDQSADNFHYWCPGCGKNAMDP
jgi:endogenous inhibitor of DNA gyrase (YacG/DUF329 family)